MWRGTVYINNWWCNSYEKFTQQSYNAASITSVAVVVKFPLQHNPESQCWSLTTYSRAVETQQLLQRTSQTGLSDVQKRNMWKDLNDFMRIIAPPKPIKCYHVTYQILQILQKSSILLVNTEVVVVNKVVDYLRQRNLNHPPVSHVRFIPF